MKKEDVYDTHCTVEWPLPFLWPYHAKRLIKNKHGKRKENSYSRKCNLQDLFVED